MRQVGLKVRSIVGGSVLAVSALSGSLVFAGAAGAAGLPQYGPTPGSGQSGSASSEPVVTSGAAASTSTSSGGLAFTGADVAVTVAAGAGAIGLGGAFVLVSRRRRHSPAV